jgi:hypothetical protein
MMEERRGSVESSEPDDGITEDRMDLRARLPGGVSLGNHRRYIAQYSKGEGMTFKPGARYCGHGRRDEQDGTVAARNCAGWIPGRIHVCSSLRRRNTFYKGDLQREGH